MLEALVGSSTAERVLLFTSERERGYPAEIARTLDVAPNQVQRVMGRMERDGLLVAQDVGRTRAYEINPRFAFGSKVVDLFKEALSRYPDDIQDKVKTKRCGPRRKGSPIEYWRRVRLASERRATNYRFERLLQLVRA